MNKNTWFIFPIELYIIIQIRKIRLELDISGEDISDYLEKNEKYIGHMESAGNNSKYNDEILSQIAIYFTKIANERQKELLKLKDHTIIKTEYTIHDFYPTEILSNEKVIKEIPPIPSGSGPAPTLNALIEATDFFKKARTLNEIVTKANEVQNENWEASDFTRPLDRAVKGKNQRLKIILNESGLNTYILTKKSKPKND
ncbi:hypothetical protein FAZ15_17315 [Sphingobacterium olei]|uniref:Uncharacterized protein n=1 Tax=Sphingobacterium olei TaxID=2571155 RepID=A0A4U0NU49_9SPHI|nr:hypothetical protein [Sphingobacterium olei]TJZ53784.1 hypothetical protein FAZ15_17315 [Sphingobacterium olei]